MKGKGTRMRELGASAVLSWIVRGVGQLPTFANDRSREVDLRDREKPFVAVEP